MIEWCMLQGWPATVEPGTFGFTNPPFGGYPHYCEICEVFYPQEAD